MILIHCFKASFSLLQAIILSPQFPGSQPIRSIHHPNLYHAAAFLSEYQSVESVRFMARAQEQVGTAVGSTVSHTRQVCGGTRKLEMSQSRLEDADS